MLEIKRTSTPPPESYIFRVACTALEELWTVELQPDILVDSSIALSHAARKVLCGIAVQLTYHQCLLLCCIKWEFSANEAVDQSWAFYFGQGDQDFSNPVQRYNAQTGNKINIEFAASCFAKIKEISEAQLREKYWYPMNVARAFLQLKGPSQLGVGRVDYLCNQVYNFCLACLKDTTANLDRRLVQDWYYNKLGKLDVSSSIFELNRMPEYPVTLVHIQRASKLATVVHCGSFVEALQEDTQTLYSVLQSLQRLSEWSASQDSFTEEVIPPFLDDYIAQL